MLCLRFGNVQLNVTPFCYHSSSESASRVTKCQPATALSGEAKLVPPVPPIRTVVPLPIPDKQTYPTPLSFDKSHPQLHRRQHDSSSPNDTHTPTPHSVEIATKSSSISIGPLRRLKLHR